MAYKKFVGSKLNRARTVFYEKYPVQIEDSNA